MANWELGGYNPMWNPYTSTQQTMGQGFHALGGAIDNYRAQAQEKERFAQAQAQDKERYAQTQYSDPFKRHMESVLNGSVDARQAALNLKAEQAGGQSAFQGPQLGGTVPTQMPQPDLDVISGGAPGTSTSYNLDVPTSNAPGFGVDMPRPMEQMRTERRDMRDLGDNSSLYPMLPRQGDVSGMARPATGGTSGGTSGVGQAQRRAPFLQTNQDVVGAMNLLPYSQQKKGTQGTTARDYLEEIRLRAKVKGEEDRRTEGVRQTGRVTVARLNNAQRSLDRDVREAYQNDSLTERDAHHIEQIELGYEQLRSLESRLDTNLRYKRESGDDEMLKAAVATVTRMTAARVDLVASAFAKTPEGQRTIANLDPVLALYGGILSEYATGMRVPTGTGAVTTGTSQTTGGRTGGQRGAQKPPPPAPDTAVHTWVRNDGQRASGTAAQIKARKDSARWTMEK